MATSQAKRRARLERDGYYKDEVARILSWCKACERDDDPLASFKTSIRDMNAAGYMLPGFVVQEVVRELGGTED